jgi:hypothetical protein
MGIFFEKPTKGPDAVGGLWPIKDRARVWNRSGATLDYGDVVMIALTPGEATEIATNDVNSYIPGASNDTVWNTVIDPISNVSTGASVQRGGCIVAVVLDTQIEDSKAGWVQTFGIAEAYVHRANTTSSNPGSPLTVYGSNAATKINTFDPIILSNERVFATLMGYSNGALTTRRLRKVFLHQGLFGAAGGQAFT